MDMDYKSIILFLSVIQGITAIRILNDFSYEKPTLHEDTDDERAILELKTEMHWLIGWLHGDYCEIKDNEYSDIFFIDGKTVKKHACSSPGCGPACYASGCLSFLRQSEYVLKIRCDQNLFNVRPFTTDSDTAVMHIRISKNQEPKVFIDPGNVNIAASEAYPNQIIETVSYTDAESDAVTLTCTGSDNFRLVQEFGRGTIVLVKDLQNEKSSTFTVNIFATDRRNTVTQSLEIRHILSTKKISTNRITTPMSIGVSIPTNRKPTGDKIPPSEDIHNPVLYIIIPAPGDSKVKSKDIHNPILYIVIPLAVFASVTVAAVVIFWMKRHPRINGYRKLKENVDDLDKALEAGVENPTYFLITSQKT